MDLTAAARLALFALLASHCRRAPAAPAATLAPSAADERAAPGAPERGDAASPPAGVDAGAGRSAALGVPFVVSAPGERWSLPDGATLEVIEAGWATMPGGGHVGFARFALESGGQSVRGSVNTSNTPRAEVGAYAVEIVSPAPVQLVVRRR